MHTGTVTGTDSPAPVTDPAWARPALVVLLVGTAVLYFWGLGSSGWANAFYSAAVQAGSESWKAFFFGSSDAANAITVDKTPLSLWPMTLSVRMFGMSSWSILVPQALLGVATVALVHRTVRRTTGSAAAGLVAGAVMALTPVAVLMFRFNNPDAMLVLLLTGAGVATLRAIEESRDQETGRPLRWLVLGGSLVGLAFLTKMLQAFLVLPALALVYLLCAHTPLGRRIAHLLAAFAAIIVAGGWWIAVVQLWPRADRPYIGGSQSNSILELTLGYNGLGRLNGEQAGSVSVTGAPGPGHWGGTGVLRLFYGSIGGQIAWLLPAALILTVGAFWFARRDRQLRAGLLLWTATLLVTGLTFSFMAGIFHAYYTIALAPPVAALVGIGTTTVWRYREHRAARAVLASAALVTAALAVFLLRRSPEFLAWLPPLVVVAGVGAVAGLLRVHLLTRRGSALVAGLALVSALAGPTAYAVDTAGTPHTGAIPSAGPPRSAGPSYEYEAITPPPPLRPSGSGLPLTGPGSEELAKRLGGLLDASTSTPAINRLLRADADDHIWGAAAVGSNVASGYQLEAGTPVMAIGGFNGSDPFPSLAQFRRFVADGEIHYFVAGGLPGVAGTPSAAIERWVRATFSPRVVDGVTLYDLTPTARRSTK